MVRCLANWWKQTSIGHWLSVVWPSDLWPHCCLLTYQILQISTRPGCHQLVQNFEKQSWELRVYCPFFCDYYSGCLNSRTSFRPQQAELCTTYLCFVIHIRWCVYIYPSSYIMITRFPKCASIFVLRCKINIWNLVAYRSCKMALL